MLQVKEAQEKVGILPGNFSGWEGLWAGGVERASSRGADSRSLDESQA